MTNPANDSAPTKKATILYIEDNPLNAKLVQRILGSDGYEVVIAENGLKGIDAALSTKPDLILMDINLPDLSGREVTTRLRAIEEFKTTPIVALTAQTDEQQRAMTIAAGVDGYITKPFEVEELSQRIVFHLRGGKEQFKVDMNEAQKQFSQEIVTHLERKLREAEASNDALKRLDKMKDDFIQRVAHELRTPLTIIYGYGRLLQTAEPLKALGKTNPEFPAYIDGLVESIERLHGTVNEILTIYRIATGEFEIKIGPTHLREIVEASIHSFAQAVTQRNIAIKYSKDEWPSLIQADNELLKLVFNNLIGNAIKYTPDGGSVTLKASMEENVLKISIADTGIGISLDEQSRIFESFYAGGSTDLHSTSKTAFQGGGLGLGLSITKGIIDAHNGKISVESSGKDEKALPGSTFHIELPLRKTYKQITGQQAAVAEDSTPHHPAILPPETPSSASAPTPPDTKGNELGKA